MAKKKKIPCRVCGKLFVPCAYCQSHADTFRWRNFACSKECATKYINEAIAYREALKDKGNGTAKKVWGATEEIPVGQVTTARKKHNRKISADDADEIDQPKELTPEMQF